MKLSTTTTSERGKAQIKTGNSQIVVDVNINRITVGRLVLRYEEVNNRKYTVYYYPVSTVKGGRTLLHEQSDINVNVHRTQ